MHLVIPFAAPLAEPGRAALASVQPTGMLAWLAGARELAREMGDEFTSLAPHERVLAQWHGWPADAPPFAAQAAAADGIAVGDKAWGLVTPVHWRLGTEQVSLIDPAALALDEAASRAFFDAVAPLFTSEGFEFAWGAPLRWYLAHPSLAALPTASLDRVIGRNVDRWLGRGAPLVRRLQNEVQMLLHEHPLNQAREGRGALAVNSFWLSGCGLARPARDGVAVDSRLRAPALAEDWAAWAKAWDVIDAEWSAPDRLTLAGERGAMTWERGSTGFVARLKASLATPRLPALLEGL